ncbi:MAG: hypothetical protein KGL93_07925 [Gemmatimonadota bacterium]|nr:hypothetical protein [Gemmatimonadota bacterium]
MTPRTSRGLWLVVAAATSAAAGCSSDSRPTAPLQSSQTVALAVAKTFDRMGDSVVAAHGDSDAATRYYGAAAVLRRIPAFDTITITIDSVPMQFNAVGLAVTDSGGPATCPMPPMDDDRDAAYECPWGIPHTTRTLFAWQPGHPPHIIQLVATSDSGAIGLPNRHRSGDGASDTTTATVSTDSTGALLIPARLKYFSGDGTGVWWGTSGSQMNAVQANTTPCPKDTSAADSTSTDSTSSADRGGMGGDREGHGWNGLHMATASCQTATLTFAFSGTVSLPPVDWWHRNTASGTHTISLAASSVPGASVTMVLQAGGSGH